MCAAVHIFENVVRVFFFFQAEDGIRDLVRSRGLGDVYKRQVLVHLEHRSAAQPDLMSGLVSVGVVRMGRMRHVPLSLIHI